jgi:hypothetical protein
VKKLTKDNSNAQYLYYLPVIRKIISGLKFHLKKLRYKKKNKNFFKKPFK